MTAWADVAKGDDVVMGGRTYRVRKVKLDGKRVTVTVERDGRKFTSQVKAKDEVQVVKSDPDAKAFVDRVKAGPLRNAENGQARWATSEEAGQRIEPGDASIVKPSAALSDDPWELPRDRVERKLDKLLGAHLIGEATDVDAGYYVPPVDVTTVAAHLVLFHPNIYDGDDDEATMMQLHSESHALALGGDDVLSPNHWHTKTRPEASA